MFRKSMNPKIFDAKCKRPASWGSELIPLPSTAKVFMASSVTWPICVSDIIDRASMGNNITLSHASFLSAHPSFPPSFPESKSTKEGNIKESSSHCSAGGATDDHPGSPAWHQPVFSSQLAVTGVGKTSGQSRFLQQDF